MRKHPNAIAAGGSSIGGVLVVWLLSLLGVEIDGVIGAAITGGLATVALFIGREGLRGLFRRLWRGQS